jgi:16S rRNA (adenine1518-N6/adenine1519-N6)-dimethyltransferase
MANTQLGQHWLRDPASLYAVAEAAGIRAGDTVLEIGPGQGTLTEVLLEEAGQVMAVEVDVKLAGELARQLPSSNLEVVNADIMQFDLDSLPEGYKVAANIPYYITSPIIMRLLTAGNPPARMGLLVQKEVARRIGAEPGDLSVLGVAVQSLAEVDLGDVVPAHYFKPQPKVDSQIISLRPRKVPLLEPHEQVMKLVKAGFLNRRKTLANSLASTLPQDKVDIEAAIRAVGLPENIRAQSLDVAGWQRLYGAIHAVNRQYG